MRRDKKSKPERPERQRVDDGDSRPDMQDESKVQERLKNEGDDAPTTTERGADVDKSDDFRDAK